ADQNIIIRNLNSDFLNKFVAVNGVVTKISEVKPKLVNACFQCNHCARVYNIMQTDSSGSLIEPGVCSCERKSFLLLTNQSTFIDRQIMEMQEPLEITRGGEQTRKIAIVLEDDMTNKIIPGDKLEVAGVLKLMPPKKGKTSVYDTFIDSNHIEKLQQEFEELELTEEDEEKIKELSNDPKLFDKIASSIAPSIYGHREIKEAIALQLFGGTPRKVTQDGMKIRPDIHILLIGDPGVAKTRLLMYVHDLAPKGIYVSGRATTGAGLTATAEKDEFADGAWVLKAGALVLAAGGMAMIDEFDKMDEHDKSSMHEAMETQQISVAKAGIIATFKANASILAAANPKYGRFDPYETPASQFEIPPTIISRFDLIFPMRDVLDPKRDSELADTVLTSHYTSGIRATQDYDKKKIEEMEKSVTPVINSELLRKYIAYARRNTQSVLTEEAMEKIKSFYIDLRRIGEKTGSIPITARYLEAIVRLAEASAKVRLSPKVELEDSERAISLLRFSLKQIGVDPETGKLDIDIIATGTSKSKADKIRSVMRMVKKLNADYGSATHEAMIEEAKVMNIEQDELEEILQQLKRNGDIYSPGYGSYKPAEGEK
ncbi:MAG: minichromosome maintenance protein MCM, partial [Candidatus Micrarchaeota archaeon]